MTRPKSFRSVTPDPDRRCVWWVHNPGGEVLGSVYKHSWRDPDNVLGWMSSPTRVGKDWGNFRTMAGAVAWLYAPEYRQRRFSLGLPRHHRSRANVEISQYHAGHGGKTIEIPGHSLVTVNGVERGVVNQVPGDPGMWWFRQNPWRCNWSSPMPDGVLRFTSFDDAVRFASQLCGTPGCRYCDKETGDE